MKKYRAKIKKNKVKYEAVKAKDPTRYYSKKAKADRNELSYFRTQTKLHQWKCRDSASCWNSWFDADKLKTDGIYMKLMNYWKKRMTKFIWVDLHLVN